MRELLRLRVALASVMALSLALPVAGSPTDSLQGVLARHSARVDQSNQLLYVWQNNVAKAMATYLPKRGQPDGPNEDVDMLIDTKPIKMKPRTIEEMQRDDSNQDLVLRYYGHQGDNRYHGIFIESGAAWTGSYQWNTQRNAGFAVKSLRDKFLDQAAANKIFNIRMGVNTYELDWNRPETLNGILDFHREAWKRGISVTDSVLFFSGLKVMETKGPDGKIDPTRSYQNNPKFPDYAEKMAEFVLTAIFKEQEKFNTENAKLPVAQQKPVARTAVNPVNEPETFAGFNNFWNNGFANWGDPNVMRLYVPTIINIARANVRIRMATERAARGERVLFFHNEAITPKDYPSHQGDLQFAVSKLMLGDKQLMDADLDRLGRESLDQMKTRFDAQKAAGEVNVVEGCILHFSQIPANNTPGKVEAARKAIIAQLRLLKNDHLAYHKMSGKTAKTDTILMLDYYQQSEFILPETVPVMIKNFSANHGELLKKILLVGTDAGFMTVLKERTQQAEAATGQKIWPDGLGVGAADLASLDIAKLLTQEDGIVMDKLVGLRNEWSYDMDALSLQRRTAAGYDPGPVDGSDEKRIDLFFNSILASNAQLLKNALGVQTDAQLMDSLRTIGLDTSKGGAVVDVQPTASLRDVLNQKERTLVHRIFGLQRIRRTGFLPPHYARQTRAEMRKGFYEMFLNYVDELGIRTAGIGESGTPYYPWASMVHKQMMLALTAAAKMSNTYLVRNDVGPAAGTIGWMSGPMTGDLKTNGKRGEDGVFKLVRTGPYQFEYQLSAWQGQHPWYSMYREDFASGLKAAQAQIDRLPRSSRMSVPESSESQKSSSSAVKKCSALYTGT